MLGYKVRIFEKISNSSFVSVLFSVSVSRAECCLVQSHCSLRFLKLSSKMGISSAINANSAMFKLYLRS